MGGITDCLASADGAGPDAVWAGRATIRVVGVLILATLQNLFNSLGLSSALQSLVEGAILIAAVSTNTFLRLNRK